MLLHNIRLAWRNISNHKTYTLINMLGLALGICTCIVIYLIVSYEYSFDAFHPGKERIFRIGGKVQEDNGTQSSSALYTEEVPPPVPAAFREEFPD